MKKRSILHIVPNHVDAVQGQGSYKDVEARRLFFSRSDLTYACVNVSGDNPRLLRDVLTRVSPTHILFEYSYFPRMVSFVRHRIPDVRIAVRSHNAEPLQHWAIAVRDSPIRTARVLVECARLFVADLVVGEQADRIFPISPLEASGYWRRLGVASKVIWLPYLPPPEFRARERGDADIVACLPSGAKSRRSKDGVERFFKFASRAKQAGWTERFIVTGDVASLGLRVPPCVEGVGQIGDLATFYKSVLAVTVLSPLGHGFKTTIADALWAGASALVHPNIRAELPNELQARCVEVETLNPASFEGVHSRLLATAGAKIAVGAIEDRFEREMKAYVSS